ncbi:hypothetical protein PFISCL1PPCAC_2362, partial [Pristionchus fissidentatus]
MGKIGGALAEIKHQKKEKQPAEDEVSVSYANPEEEQTNSPVYESFVHLSAGTISGAAGVLAGHPLDTVKVRLQTQEAASKLYRGTWHCFSTILQKEKISGLYKGITPPLASLCMINATVFGVQWSISRQFENPDSIAAHFWAGFAAGFCQSIIATPSERVKLLIQIQNDAAHTRYKSPVHAARSLWKREGVRGITRGYWATVFRDCPAFGIYFASY